MATYKVLQDVEAEDKFVGPLTLKQFIFVGIGAVCTYLAVFFLTRDWWYLALPELPIILVCGFLGFPWGRDQPTEVWLLAKLRFLFKPRRRIWDQSGMQELVRITAPKKTVEFTGDGLSPTEVKSRLKALAETIDSRGWAVKNVNVNLYTQPEYATAGLQSDRLVEASSLPQTGGIATDVGAADDIFISPKSSNVDAQIDQAAQLHKNEVRERLEQNAHPMASAPSPGLWFTNQPQPTGQQEHALLEKLHKQKQESAHNHRHKIEDKLAQSTPAPAAASPLTNTSDPAILNLASDNSRNVASLAREASQLRGPQAMGDDEVVVSLH